MSIFKRLMTAVTNPFRLLVVRAQRLFNVNVLTAKLIPTLTKKVKSLITLRPQSPKDYFSVGRYWVYKKLLLTLVLVACAGVFIYFTMFASPLPATPAQPEQVRKLLLDEIARLRREGVDGTLFTLCKNELYGELIAGLESVDDVAAGLFSSHSRGRTLAQEIEALASLTKRDADEALQMMLREENSATVIIRPTRGA